MNKQLIFVKRPEGLPESNTWNLEGKRHCKAKKWRSLNTASLYFFRSCNARLDDG